MPRLYGRVVRATIRPKDGPSFLIDGHDIAFDVEKTKERDPNKGKITFYNLPADMRGKLKLNDTATVELEAGYPETVATIFKGNVTHSISDLQGPDIVTVVEAEEGVKAYRSSFHTKTYGAGTPFKTVVNDIVKSFEGMHVTSAITKVLSTVGTTFPDGVALDGPSAKILSDVLQGVGLSFSIQKGEIQITREGEPTDDPIVKLDYSSGLVGVPQLGEKKEKPTITFQSFIQPELIPRRRVFVDWVESKGEFVVDSVKHQGSNFDNAFYSTVQAFIK